MPDRLTAERRSQIRRMGDSAGRKLGAAIHELLAALDASEGDADDAHDRADRLALEVDMLRASERKAR